MAMHDDFRKTAEMVWGALDKLSEENPEEYKKFIDQQLKEGSELLAPPQPAYCLECSVNYKVAGHIIVLSSACVFIECMRGWESCRWVDLSICLNQHTPEHQPDLLYIEDPHYFGS